MRKFFCWWISVVCGCIVVGWLVLCELPDGRLHVYALDVGQGDSMLLKLPHGGTVLIDGGPGSNIVEPLKRAIGWMTRKIDLVVVTHFDRDHAEGFLHVLQDYDVGQVMLTGVEQRTELQARLFSLIREKGIPVWIVDASTDVVLDQGFPPGDNPAGPGDDMVIMDVLSPFTPIAGTYFKNANETSIVTRILVGDGGGNGNVASLRSAILTTGDIGFEMEKKLVAKYGASGELRAEILKVGHHGSRYSSGEDFLSRVRATWAMISVSAKNTYGHPHPDALGRLGRVMDTTQILRTDQRGTIEMVIDHVHTRPVWFLPASHIPAGDASAVRASRLRAPS